MSIRSSRFRSAPLFLLSISGAMLLAACNSTAVPTDSVVPTVSVSATPTTLNTSGPVAVTVTASDDVGVSKVELYDNTVKVGEDTTAPYTFAPAYGPGQSASHVLTARAYDAAGNTAEASTIVKVDIKGLSVSTNPAVLTYPGPVKVTAVANPEIGRTISKVEFLDNGVLIGTAITAPYTTTLNYTPFQNGPHEITARSTDSTGAVLEAKTSVSVALDASEPNETTATARLIAIGSRTDGSVSGLPRDQDYFSFAAKAGDQLRLTVKSQSVFAGSTLDPYVEVLLPDGRTILEKDDDSGLGLESELLFNVTTDGTYYIHVTSFKLHDDPAATDDKATNTYRMDLSRR